MEHFKRSNQVLAVLFVTSVFHIAAGAMDIKLRCNDRIDTLYVDGESEGPDTFSWREKIELDVSDTASIIAVKWSNFGGTSPGLIAWASTDIVSDDINWKCTTEDEDNWYYEHFDSSGWESAKVVCTNDNCGNLEDSNFPDNANWIQSAGGSTATHTYCRGQLGPVSVHAGCKRSGDIYVDGELSGSGRGIVQSEFVSTPSLIALSCTRDSRYTGWTLASLSNGFISGTSWKCKTGSSSNWEDINYDDNDWDQAVIVGNSKSIDDVSDEDATIWFINPSKDSDETTCYCRGAVGIRATVDCNDNGNVYVDGVKMNGDEIRNTWTSIIPRTARLIAIKAENTNGRRGIYAEISNDFKTSSTWRCSSEFSEGWKTADFDDTTDGWDYAITSDGFDNNNYIWEKQDVDGIVYCRGHFECGCEHKCVPSIDGYNFKCVCPDGFTGANCDEPVVNECNDGTYDCGHGDCVDTVESYICVCDDEYGGDKCDTDIDECASGPCLQDAPCQNTDGSFTCDCDGTNYEGHICDEERTDECLIKPCQNEGNCEDGYKSFTCDCSDTGFEGPSCIIETNDCLDNPCQPGTCEDGHKQFICNCSDTGYEGLTCSDDVDECSSDTLHICDQGICVNSIGSYSCSCKKGYTGVYCDSVSEKSGKSGSSMGVGAGAGGGAVALLLILAVVIAVIVYRRRKSQPAKGNDPLAIHDRIDSTDEERIVRTETGNEYENFGMVTKPNPSNEAAAVNETNNVQPNGHTDTAFAEKPSVTKHVETPIPSQGDPIYGNVDTVAPVSKPIKLADLSSYVQRNNADGSFETEYGNIPGGKRGECTASEREGIKPKLRFKNIMPYDYNRVVLSTVPGELLSDFVNASYIDGYKKPKHYIATQGPKKAIIHEFWKMVWEQNASLIVMVTNCNEDGRNKCDQYWPEKSTESYNDFTVTCKDKQIMSDFTFHTLIVEKDGENRIVKHCHFTSWPDKGVPRTGSALLEFRRQIKKIEDECIPPYIVHCSAGVGRTGTYIALDYLLEQAAAEDLVDVCGCVNLMRDSRMQMVQTLDQYIFIYNTLLEAIELGTTAILCSEFQQEYSVLKEVHPKKNTSKMQEQFQLLETLKPSYDRTKYSESLREAGNAAKNRNKDILPVNKYRPCLKTRSEFPSDYINAVLVDGYHSRREFVVTQMPLEKTVVDIWRLVEDFEIRIIVQLNENENEVPYYPEETGESIDTTLYTITNSLTKKEDSIIVRALDISRPELEESLRVQHISLTGWPSRDPLPKDPDHLLAVFNTIQKQKQQHGVSKAPILVQCLDGAERCGLFCAVCGMLEKINAEQEVDVFNTVKDIRQSRPQFISTQEQYRYLYETVKSYLSTFDLYANFK